MNEAFRVKKILQSLWCSSASKNFQKLNGKQAFLLNCRLSHSVHLPVDLYIFTSLQMDQLRVNITRSVASRLEKFTPMEVVANIEVSHVRQ